MNRYDSIFDKIQNSTNIDQDQLFDLANSVEGANFQDKETVRQLITQVANMAGVPVSKAKEDQLVEAITNNQVPMDFNALNELLKG